MGNVSVTLLSAAGADLPAEVADVLVEAVGRGKRLKGDIDLKARPSDVVAVRQVRDGGVGLACSIASCTPSQPVLDHVVAKDRRRLVRRAVLSNPARTVEHTLAVFSEAVRKDDDETYCSAARVLDPLPLLRACDELVVGSAVVGRIKHHFARVSARDEALTVLACGTADFAREALWAVACGKVDGLGIDEALGAAALEPWDKSEALGTSAAQLTAAQAEVVVDGYSERWGRTLSCNLDEDAALVLYASGQQRMMTYAVGRALSVRLVDAVAEAGRREDVDLACASATTAEQASRLLPAVLAHLAQTRSVVPERRYSFVRETWGVPQATELLQRGLLDGDETLALLRSGFDGLTRTWLAGRFLCKPRPGDLAALAAEPGMAFNALGDEEPADAAKVRKAVGATSLWEVEGHPWAPEVYALYPGLLASCGDTGAARWAMDRLTESFGAERRLWEQLLGLAPSFTGTLDELVQVCAVTAGVELSARPAGPADANSELAAQPSLFD